MTYLYQFSSTKIICWIHLVAFVFGLSGARLLPKPTKSVSPASDCIHKPLDGYYPKGKESSGERTVHANVTSDWCYARCCEDQTCDVAYWSDMDVERGQLCFLFRCRSVEQCSAVRNDQADGNLTSVLFQVRDVIETDTSPIVATSTRMPSTSPAPVIGDDLYSAEHAQNETDDDVGVEYEHEEHGEELPELHVQIIGQPVVYFNQTSPATVTLKAHFTEPPAADVPLSFNWNLFNGGVNSDMVRTLDDQLDDSWTITGLPTGKYKATVEVSTGVNEPGTAEFSFEVVKQKIVNKPVAKIEPPSVHNTEHTKVSVSATSSTADGTINAYKWAIFDAAGSNIGRQFANQPNIDIDDLKAGNYTLRLQITDSFNQSASAAIAILVDRELDYKPKPVISECGETGASSSITKTLPVKQINLCANQSSDDKGIVSYKWSKTDSPDSVDIMGVANKTLQIMNFKTAGDYSFQLEVTDTVGQTGVTDVTIIVAEAKNLPPKAVVGPPKNITLPVDKVTLDGSESKDDHKIVSYQWRQVGVKPSLASMTQGSNPWMVTAQGLDAAGQYKFSLNVTDENGLSDVAIKLVNVDTSNNQPPVAQAKNVTVTLPVNFAILNGSTSRDDGGIVGYSWKLMSRSPAGLEILYNSEKTANLYLANFVPGVYYFNFSVFDLYELRDSILVLLTVDQGATRHNLVEVFLTTPLVNFTTQHLHRLQLRLQTSLQTQCATDDDIAVSVQITRVGSDHSTGRSYILLQAARQKISLDMEAKSSSAISASDVVACYSAQRPLFVDLDVDRVTSLYCENSCGGHGKCDDFTKLCTCDRYWMQNSFSWQWYTHSNCDWSVLYFVIVMIFLTIVVLAIGWGGCVMRKLVVLPKLGQHSSRSRPNRRRRYKITEDKQLKSQMRKVGNGKTGSGTTGSNTQLASLLVSASDSSDDPEADVLYTNGDTMSNGTSKASLTYSSAPKLRPAKLKSVYSAESTP